MGTAILLVYLVRRLGFEPTTVGTISLGNARGAACTKPLTTLCSINITSPAGRP